MRRMRSLVLSVFLTLTVLSLLFVSPVRAADPIVLGCPLSMAFLYGWAAERGFTLAVEEINAINGIFIISGVFTGLAARKGVAVGKPSRHLVHHAGGAGFA